MRPKIAMYRLHGLLKPTTTAPWKALEGKTHLLLLNSFSKKPIPQGFCISLGRYAF